MGKCAAVDGEVAVEVEGAGRIDGQGAVGVDDRGAGTGGEDGTIGDVEEAGAAGSAEPDRRTAGLGEGGSRPGDVDDAGAARSGSEIVAGDDDVGVGGERAAGLDVDRSGGVGDAAGQENRAGDLGRRPIGDIKDAAAGRTDVENAAGTSSAASGWRVSEPPEKMSTVPDGTSEPPAELVRAVAVDRDVADVAGTVEINVEC